MTSLSKGCGSEYELSRLPAIGLASGVSRDGDPENESDCDNRLPEFTGLFSGGCNLLPLGKVYNLESRLCTIRK